MAVDVAVRADGFKGALDDAEFRAFQADGVTPLRMIEAMAEIAHRTVTNYMNRLAGTPLDDFLEPYRDGL